jgi:hypothetical protein
VSNIAQTCICYLAQPCLVTLTWLRIEMNRFVQNENVVQLRKLIAIAEGEPFRDEVRYQLLSLLLAEEEAKPRKLRDG